MLKQLLLGCVLLCGSAIAQAQSFRLIADMQYGYENGALHKQDSGTYFYDFGRGALPENSARFGGLGWACDSMVRRMFSGGQPLAPFRHIHQFDGNNRLIMAYWTNTAGTPISRSTYHYGSSGLDTTLNEIYSNGAWQPSSKVTRTYGQDGVILQLQEVWNSTLNVFENSRRVTNTYTSGKLTQAIVQGWDGANWQAGSQTDYTYVGDNMATMVIEDFSGSAPAKLKWEYAYDMNNDLTVSYHSQSINTQNIWDTTSRRLYTYDNAHNLLTTTLQTMLFGPDFVNMRLETNTYNSANLIETFDQKSNWDGTQFQYVDNDRMAIYYYEEFDPASVSNTVKSNTALQAFPNPASNTLNIQLFAEQTTPFSITIFDATGKSVKHWNEAPTSFYQKQIDVSHLPSGNYFLRIGNRPNEAARFTVIR